MSDLIYIEKGTGALNDNVVRTFWQRQSHSCWHVLRGEMLLLRIGIYLYVYYSCVG